MSDSSSGRVNRLAKESSPYLLLHQHNPVDWYPWGEEALARARDEDKPIFLSVGYSTCYWCHVMERESFSDPAVAELMNRDFVNIKVDREERPELDEIYMVATQIFTQHGGWPNSVFLTPKLEPFFAGTYFPPEDRQGTPSFGTVVRSLADAWQSRRGDVEKQSASLGEAMSRYLEERPPAADAPPSPAVVGRSLEALASRFDRLHGGFGSTPKFPTPSNLYLLEELAGMNEPAASMLVATLDRMARGGIYDQLAGGFHRYATDREWKIPHFEKMLYDNGQLLELYALGAAGTGDPELERVARETAAFMVRELGAPDGGFMSAIDAETDGFEGAYYVWTRDELGSILGDEDFGFAAPLLGFDGAAFFEGKYYVLHLPAPLAEQAARRRRTLDELLGDLDPLRERLLAVRSERRRPLTDDKILADWNGMAIAGLARAGELLNDPGMVTRAAQAAEFVLDVMRPGGGPLIHAWRDGRGGVDAFLGDYAFFIRGLLALHRASGDSRWLESAVELHGEQERRLAADTGGYFVAAPSPDVLFRSQEVFDGALPAANAVAVLNLLDLSEATEDERYRDQAGRALAAFAPAIEQRPDGARMLALATGRWHGKVDLTPSAQPAAPSGAVAAPAAPLVKGVRAQAFVGQEAEDGWRPLTVQMEIADGWHLQSETAPGDTATTLVADGYELDDLRYPPSQELEVPGVGPRDGWVGAVAIAGRVRLPVGRPGRLTLRFQACDQQSCLPPTEVQLTVLPAAE